MRFSTKLLALSAFAALSGAVLCFLLAGSGDERKQALQACRRGAFAQAEAPLKRALARHPDDSELHDCLARGYLEANREDDAEPHLSRLIELRPEEPQYLRLRMELYRKQKRRDEALADALKLLELEPEKKLQRTAMTQAFATGNFEVAEAQCLALLRDEPTDRSLRSMLAQIRRARGDDEDAGRILDQLIADDPEDFGALVARGILYDEMGHPAEAAELLRNVYAKDPTRKRSCGYQLSLALEKIGEHEEAISVLAEVRRLQEIEVYGDAIKSQPDNLELHVRLAESLLRDGYSADGIGLLKSVLNKSPSFAPAHLAMAAEFERQGKPELAARHRQQANQSP